MAQVCPIIFRKIDANIARLNAIWVSLFVLLFLSTGSKIWLYFLALDFVTRLFISKKYSLINQLSTLVKKGLNIEARMEDAGAKRVAAIFGLVFILLLIITSLLDLRLLNHTVAATLLSCTLLEIAFSYCIGCQVYFLYKKFTSN